MGIFSGLTAILLPPTDIKDRETTVILDIAKNSDMPAVEEALTELLLRTKLYYADEIEERTKAMRQQEASSTDCTGFR